MQKILHLFILLNISFSSFGYDAELNESRKCINAFRQFEQKLKLPEDTLFAIGLHETKKIHSKYKKPIAWPWTVNVKGKGYYFKNKKEAVRFVKENIQQGTNNIDVGCMQVNLKHHPDAFRSIEQALNPRHNISYGANFLLKKYRKLGSWGEAISHYHSSAPTKGKKYKMKVLNIAKNMEKHKSLFKIKKSINNSPQKTKNTEFDNRSKKYKSSMMVSIPKKKNI